MKLIIGSNFAQCDKCNIWYQSEIEHVCKTKDLTAAGFNYYNPSNIKNPQVFRDADKATQRLVDEALERVERIKKQDDN